VSWSPTHELLRPFESPRQFRPPHPTLEVLAQLPSSQLCSGTGRCSQAWSILCWFLSLPQGWHSPAYPSCLSQATTGSWAAISTASSLIVPADRLGSYLQRSRPSCLSWSKQALKEDTVLIKQKNGHTVSVTALGGGGGKDTPPPNGNVAALRGKVSWQLGARDYHQVTLHKAQRTSHKSWGRHKRVVRSCRVLRGRSNLTRVSSGADFPRLEASRVGISGISSHELGVSLGTDGL
jgi:hypothetical protein